MKAREMTTIRLAGRRAIGDVMVDVLHAAMDEGLGNRVAELHLAREGYSGDVSRFRKDSWYPSATARDGWNRFIRTTGEARRVSC